MEIPNLIQTSMTLCDLIYHQLKYQVTMLGNCLQYPLYVHFFLLLIHQKDFLLKLQAPKIPTKKKKS